MNPVRDIIDYGEARLNQIHAWGQPTEESDADLLIIVEQPAEPGCRLAQLAYRSLYGVRYPCDIIVHTREEVERARQVRASLLAQDH